MEISEKERLLSAVGGIMCADSKTPHERCISPYNHGKCSIREGPHSRRRDHAQRRLERDSRRELVAGRFARNSWHYLWPDLPLKSQLAVQVFVILFAAYMLVDGVFAISSGIKAARN